MKFGSWYFKDREKISESVICRLKSLKHVGVKNPDVRKFWVILVVLHLRAFLGDPELAIHNLKLGMDIMLDKIPEYINNRWRNRFCRHSLFK